MKASRWMALAGVAALVAVWRASSAAFGGSASSKQHSSAIKAALISDVVGFNDAVQQEPTERPERGSEEARRHGDPGGLALVERLRTELQRGDSQGRQPGGRSRLPARPTVATYAKNFPKVNFAITDYDIHEPPFATKSGNCPRSPRTSRASDAAEQAGCLVGVLSAEMPQEAGRQGDRCRWRHRYSAGQQLHRRLQVLREQGRAGDKRRSSSTRMTSARKTSARQSPRMRSVRREGYFQVAGACGLGALKAARRGQALGLGVDVDEYGVAKRILTSATKKTDVRGVRHRPGCRERHVQGRHRSGLQPEERGRGVGKIDPSVPKSWIALMNTYKAQIIRDVEARRTSGSIGT